MYGEFMMKKTNLKSLMTMFFSSSVLLVSCNTWALDIDEKLTMRFLKVSNSKKTVLVNRGSEDGLVVGDHAKFFITQGVIARGVVVKASPSRTIWSIYRIVDPNEVSEGKVLNLKISTPVKLTEDPSKSLKDEGVEAGADKISIPLAEGADDLPKDLSDVDKDELKELGVDKSMDVETNSSKAKGNSPSQTSTKNIFTDEPMTYSSSAVRNWEVYSSFYLSSLSGTQNDANADSTETTNTTIDLSVGAEKYFANSSMETLKNSSLLLFLRMRNNESGSSSSYGFNNTEYGVGLNYHLLESPFATQKMIGVLSATLGLGSVERTVKTVNNSTVEESSTSGSSTFFSIGAGIKMNMNRHWGARVIFDYYSNSSSFEDENGNSTELTQSGPRFNVGLSYAF